MLTIYKASAGSGKTYTLALQYIRILLGVKRSDNSYVLNHSNYLKHSRKASRHRHILAVTFTNKATAEMKQRIISELYALSQMPANGAPEHAAYASPLISTFACTRQELADVADIAFREMLDDYGNFNVSTIDAFFQTVLRSFAREIDRQGDYRLEIKPENIIGQAMAMLFDELNLHHDDPQLATVGEWIRGISRNKSSEGKDFNPFNRRSGINKEITQLVFKSFDESFQELGRAMDEYMDNLNRLTEFEKWLDREIERLRACIYDIATDAISDFGPLLNKNASSLFSKIVENGGDFDSFVAETEKTKSQYIKNLLAGDGSGCFPAKLKERDAVAPRAATAYMQMAAHALYGNTLRLLRKSTIGIWAINYIREYVDRYRQENNMILLADTNTLLGSIISESDTPFIYEKVGVELENFLIDEFQDTSRLQWRNLQPLLANSMGEDHDSLIIGDVKQSIYRFRGADSELLDTTVETDCFPAPRSRVLGSGPGENTNYRSAPMLVKFNNSLFTALANEYGVKGYSGIAQTPSGKMAGRDASLRILKLDTQEGADLAKQKLGDLTTESGVALTSFDDNNLALALTAERIRSQKARGYRYSDIAILCRRGDAVVEVADFFRLHYPSIKIVSEEGLLLSHSPAVKMIVGVLEMLDKNLFENDDKDRPATIVDDPQELRRRRYRQSRRRRSRLNDMFHYYVAQGKDVAEALKQAIDVSVADSPDAGVVSEMEELRRLAPSNLAALIEAIISLKIPEFQRAAENAYISAFVDLASEFMQDFNPSLHMFLRHWESIKNKASVSPSESADAVTICTVHKSKGLEWDCVHLPLMNWDLVDKNAWNSGTWLRLTDDPRLPAEITPPVIYLRPESHMMTPDSPYREFLEGEVDKEISDNMNVLYVAFTRAARELDVNITAPGFRKTNKIYAGDAITKALSSTFPNDDIYCDLSRLADSNGNVTEGPDTHPTKAEETAPEMLLPPPFAVSFNALNSRFSRLEDLTVLNGAPDDPEIGNGIDRQIVDTPEPPFQEAMEAAARKGLVMHAVLSELYSLEDLDSAVRRHRHQLPASDAATLADEIREAFVRGGELVDGWFEPSADKVLNEQPVYDASAGCTRRVDRIVFRPDGSIDVVDYKFTSRERKTHYDQVRDYVYILRDIYPGRRISGWLWYPLLEKVKNVL